MLQLFFKTTEILPKDWEKAYQRIKSIAASFPLKLLRVEAYNGWSKEIDKEQNSGSCDIYFQIYFLNFKKIKMIRRSVTEFYTIRFLICVKFSHNFISKFNFF